ncbi:hypothetical protein [Polyangium fumosum]|uniref:Uncharacterized protein n=1 Tax=Polyangium fumosum TaxID=889272 RepID=A0A4V6WQR0_9BACT|nr:hypothetical protein [Polyangium fumosum]TKD05120.1 hypothetical protein E8A74_21480 [Polyangium fumosum]
MPLPKKEVPLLVARPLSPARSFAPEALQDLTALSGVRRRPSLPEGHFQGFGALARRSLQAFLLAVLAPGCLVTAEPVTYEPQQTPPILVASGLDPDPRSILLVGGDLGLPEFPIVASVASEDAGESVKVALYVDYGEMNAFNQPFRWAFPNFQELPAATLADGPRPLVGVRWNSTVYPLDAGCHRLTLVVTHEFDTQTGCPKDLRDSSQITWQFRQCGVGDCPPILENCPSAAASCPLDPTAATGDMKDAGTTGG